MKIPLRITTFGAALIVLTVGAAPLLSSAADHIDASAFGSVGSPGGAFNPVSANGERDINDVYAFQGSNASRTVLVMTTNPAINAFGGKFGANVRYILNVDRDGDAVQDLAYVVRFDNGAAGNQKYTVTRYTGSNAVSLARGEWRGSGSTAGNGTATLNGNGKAFAGVRSDPFFFDLTGFVGTLFDIGDDALGDNPTDIFTGFNTNAIVIEVPDDQLGGTIGVWGQTTWWNGSAWVKADQMGRPAINTVFNNAEMDQSDREKFNQTRPGKQVSRGFRAHTEDVLEALGAADPAGLAGVLIPDTLTYEVGNMDGFLNGRRLADDVIDAELALVTDGAITTDCIDNDSMFSNSWPYLAPANH
jgi:hypothetical protein